jgi:hypothetical protein
MRLLIVSNVLQVIIERRGEAGVSEILERPGGDSLLVKSVLEVFELLDVSNSPL